MVLWCLRALMKNIFLCFHYGYFFPFFCYLKNRRVVLVLDGFTEEHGVAICEHLLARPRLFPLVTWCEC